MNTDNGQNNTGRQSKLFGFISLVVVLLILAWSTTQVVKLFPSAVSSLASIADTVYNYDTNKEFKVMTDRPTLKSGETLVVWWNKEVRSGTFAFTYTCKEGVAIDLKTEEKDFTSVACGQTHDLGLIEHIELKINSEKIPFVETEFNIAYIKKNEIASTTSVTKTVSVTNDMVKDDEKEDNDTEDIKKPAATSTKSTSTKPIASKPTKPEITYTYEMPVSKPNGFTDLLLSNLIIGTKNNAGIFVKTNSITKNKEGAIQFTVHNIGTKTSDTWIFETKLPGDVDFISSNQAPLKPNERATITLSFPSIKDTDLQKIKVTIKTKRDTNEKNNALEQTVIVLQ